MAAFQSPRGQTVVQSLVCTIVEIYQTQEAQKYSARGFQLYEYIFITSVSLLGLMKLNLRTTKKRPLIIGAKHTSL